MKRQLLPTLTLALLCGIKALASQSPFYDFKVIASSAAGGSFIFFDGYLSINDSGNVAFTGGDQQGPGVFFARRSLVQGKYTWTVEPVAHGSLQSVSLNNADNLATAFLSPSAPRISSLRRYSKTSGQWLPETIVSAGAGTKPGTGLPLFPFLNILPGVSMNDDGYITFIGQDLYNTAGKRLVQMRTSSDPVPTGLFVPMSTVLDSTTLAKTAQSNGRILVRPGNQANSAITIWNSDFSGSEIVAAAGQGFAQLGQRPGCSDDGNVVGFYGDLPDPAAAESLTGANHDVVPLPVTPGPGIFASVWINNARHIVRVAGKINSGYLDPGERRPVGIRNDFGQDYNFDGSYSNPNYDWQIAGFLADARVAVSNPRLFEDQSKGSYVTIAYIAYDSRDQVNTRKALFTSRVNLFTNPTTSGIDTVGVEAPILVAQVGDTLSGFGPIDDLGLSDSLNADGQVAFWAKVGTAQAILVATPKPFADVIRKLPRFDLDSPLVEYIVPASPTEIWLPCLQPDGSVVSTQNRNHAPSNRTAADIHRVIIHATAGNERKSIYWLGAEPSDCVQRVSAHYLVSRAGRVTQIVAEHDIAFHASPQNSDTIGIELVDDDSGQFSVWRTDVQFKKAALLVRDICRRNCIPLTHLVILSSEAGEFSDYVTANGSAQCTKGIAPQAADNSFRTGVIQHGQVYDRKDCKADPEGFTWPQFMAIVNNPALIVRLNSPANLLVTDPQGRRTGYDAGSGQTLLEIPGSQFTGAGTKPQSLSIPDATNGNYTIQVVGTSNGVYRLDVYASGQDACLTQSQIAGTTSPGQTATYTLHHDAVSGDATTITGSGNLPPVAFPDFATTVSNVPVAIAVLDNDNDPEGFLNTNSVAVVTPPDNGTVSVNPTNGILTYTPTNGFVGTNTFTYTVQDNQGATSAPGVVTVIVTEPLITTNLPPLAAADFASTTNGVLVTIDVLANDSAPDGTLDPPTVTITLAPTNGTAIVDAYTGAITYTPAAGFTGTNTFLYTVRDDLGSTSAPATVTVTVTAAPGVGDPTLPQYLVTQITSGNTDHRYPRINNVGDIVWQETVNGRWQVFRKMVGQPGFQVTYEGGGYLEGSSPAIADEGQVVCYRNGTGSHSLPRDILIYPSPAAALTNPSPTAVRGSWERINELRYETDDCQADPSITSDGKAVFSTLYHLATTISGRDDYVSSLFVGGQSLETRNEQAYWDHPDANADGEIVFGRNGQVFFRGQPVGTGRFGHVNDVPRDQPDIVYANGSSLYSSIFGLLRTETPGELSGTWVDINERGVLVFERQVAGNVQVFKAYPWEVRIISRAGTNGVVGLPYRYDGDNVAEAYGAPEPGIDDPRGFLPLEWTLVTGPPGFSIEKDTGRIQWTPTATGNFTVVLRVDTSNPDFGIYTEDTQIITISVAQSTVELVDALDFRTRGTPDLPTNVTTYASGGSPRIGVLADGASRLLMRVRLLGADTNSFPALHFAIAGTNAARDGLLRPITGQAWSTDVPAAIATLNDTNTALCLYEAPVDFDAASQPVLVQLLNGTNVIAAHTLLVRRPPVVLVHDGWSGPEVWPLLISQLLDTGFDAYPVDYGFTSGGTFDANESRIFLKNLEALDEVRQSGFAATRVDLVGHGTGGILGRLHAQRYATQDYNYRKGDVHKLITIGTPHGGSWLAGTLTQLRATNTSAWTNLRSAVIAATEASGYRPPVDLDGGLITNSAPGSLALAELEPLPVASHAIATCTDALAAGDLHGFIQSLLGLTNQGDGAVGYDSAAGGIATNAFSLLPAGWIEGESTNGIPHSLQPLDTRLASLVLDLLREPIAMSNRFGFFPGNATLTNPPAIPSGATNVGGWLALTGASDGQTVTAGQTITLTAAATGGHVLSTVQFLTATGVVVVTSPPFELTYQIPATAAGRVRVTAAARDTAGEMAWKTLALNALPGATLLGLQVEPSPVILITREDFPLQVWGLYDDGSRRDITSGSAGTKYRSSAVSKIAVNTNGVLHIFDPNLLAPLTISVTNGIIATNVQVTVALSKLPPTAYLAVDRASGPSPFDPQFDATGIRGSGGSLVLAWDYGDGQAVSGPIRTSHRFLVPGDYLVRVRATDASGLLGSAQRTVTVLPQFVMIDPLLTLTQRIAYSSLILTNGGRLTATAGLELGDVLIGPGSLHLGQRSPTTGVVIDGGEMSAPEGLSGGAWAIRQGSLTLGSACTNTSTTIGTNGVITTVRGVPLDLTGNSMVVEAGGRLDADGGGFGSQAGPGAGVSDRYGTGGSHGGVGAGASTTNVYGSFREPVALGSGGGTDSASGTLGGAGGGAIRLQVGQLEVDGVISASGRNGAGNWNGYAASGAGSGGSIWITTGELSGGGLIQAAGGFAWNSGGGGRVAVYYGGRSGFSGVWWAGGTSYQGNGSGAGTIYLKKDDEAHGELIVDNGGIGTSAWSTPVNAQSPVQLKSLTLSRGASLDMANAELTVIGQTLVTGSDSLRAGPGSWLGDLALARTNRLTVVGSVAFKTVDIGDAGSLLISGATAFQTVAVSDGGSLVLDGASTTGMLTVGDGGLVTVTKALVPLVLSVTNELVVASNGVVSVAGRGHAGSSPGRSAEGPGAGRDWVGVNGGGGSHGGVGGGNTNAVGSVYGSLERPTDFGSGGGSGNASPTGGAGGGVLQLRARVARVDGVITANGGEGSWPVGGGGAGGSIDVVVGRLSGTGAIRANGGSSPGGYGGGGGRVAVEYNEKDGYAGHFEAKGAVAEGGAGTVYLKQAGEAHGELIIDNGGQAGKGTPLVVGGNLTLQSLTRVGNVRVNTSAVVWLASGDPGTFLDAITNHYLEVGGLFLGGHWVFGERPGIGIEIDAGNPVLNLTGPPDRTWLIEVSPDLSNWTTVSTNHTTTGALQWDDSEPAPEFRAYRARKVE